MVDFSHLKALEITRETTRQYIFDELEGEPGFVVSPATDDNEDFFQARVEFSLSQEDDSPDQPRKQTGKPTPEEIRKEIDQARETDRKLITKACIRDWAKAPKDKDGNDVPFTPENAYEFLCALPNYMVDPFRRFCVNVRNFTPSARKLDASRMGNS
jgi:hypothetical protein